MMPEGTRVLRRERRRAWQHQPPRRPAASPEPKGPDATELATLTAEAVELTDMAAGLNDRTRHWIEWDDTLTCWDRQEVATDEATEAARQAWERLEAAERGEAA